MMNVLAKSVVLWVLIAASALSAEPNEKAARFLTVLEQRPFSQTLFDRFFDAWLESSTIEDCESYLSAQPDRSAATRAILAQFYLRRGQPENAAAELNALVASEAPSPELIAGARLELAKISGVARDFQAALKELDGAETAYQEAKQWDVKSESEVTKLRGKFLIRLGKRDDALEVWEDFLEKRPDDDLLREDLVTLLANEGVWDKAIEQQQRLIERSGNDAYKEVLRTIALGQLYRRAGRWEDALGVWKSTLPKTGHDTWIERELIGLIGSVFRQRSNLVAWKDELNNLITAEPKRLSLRIEKAGLLADLREDVPAIEAWEEILNLTPGNREVRLEFSRTLSRLGRPAEAATQLGKLVELQPDDAELRYELAVLHFAANNPDKTRKQLNSYLEKSGVTEFSMLRVARQFDRFDLNDDAELIFRKLIDTFPESVSASEAFAAFLYDAGKTEEAVARWESIGASGDSTQLLRTANQLVNRSEANAAFSMVKDRLDDFPEDRALLELLCDLAMATDREAEAVPWALRLVDNASTGGALDQSISLAGNVAKAAGDLEGLIEDLRSAENVKRKCLLADLVRLSGETGEAVALLEEAATAEGSGADARFPLAILAGILRREDSFARAASVMEQILALPGSYTTANIQLAVKDHKKAKAPEAALKWVAEWRKISPGNKQPWIEEADLLRDQGRISESLDMLRGASRRFENDAAVQTKLADAYVLAGFPLEAERTLWKLYESIEDEWKQRGLINEILSLAMQAGRKDQIVERFELRHRNNTQAVGPLLALASVYRAVNRPDDQREALLKAGRIEPDNIQLAHQIAALDEEEGRIEQAIRVLEDAKKRDKSPRTIEILARLHLQLGQLDEAIAIYEAMPDGGRYATPDNIIGLAKALMMFGEWNLAVDFLETKLPLHADNGPIHYLHALALLESGQKSKAAKAFERLLTFKMSVAANAAASVNANQYYQIQQAFPINSDSPLRKPALKYFNLVEARRKATLYRKFSGDGQIWAFPVNRDWNTSEGNIQLPDDEASLHNYALTHLVSLADAGVHEMPQTGKYEDWELQLNRLETSVPTEEMGEFLKEYMDVPEVAILWASGYLNAAKSVIVESELSDLADRAYAAISKNYGKEIQFSAADAMRARNPAEMEKWVRTMVDVAEGIESPNPQMMRSIAYGCFTRLYQEGNDADSELNDAEQRALKLLAKYDVVSEPDNHVFRAVVQMLMVFGDDLAWLDKVKAEQKRFLEEGPGKTNPNLRRSYVNQRLHFEGISPAILEVNLPNSNNWSGHWKDHAKANVLAALDALGAPEDRLLRLHFSQVDAKRFQSELAAVEADAESGKKLSASVRVALRFNVSPEASEDERLEAVENLLDIREAEDATPDLQNSIDARIVKLAGKSEVGSQIRQYGIEAGWRFLESKNVSVSREYWEIPEYLRSWGQPREKVDRAHRAFQARYQMSASQLLGGGSRGVPQSVQHAVTLNQMLDLSQLHRRFTSNRNETNAALVASRLRLFAPGILMMTPGNFEQQYDHLVEQLGQGELVEFALDSVRPDPENSRLLDRVRFVCLQDLFGQKAEALEGYERLIAEFPEHDGLRVRRIEILAKVRPELLVDEIQSFAKNELTDSRQLNYVLSKLANLNFPTMKTRLDVAEQLIALVDSGALDSGFANQQWLGLVQNNLERYFSEGGKIKYGAIVNGNDDPFRGAKEDPPQAIDDREEFERNKKRRFDLFVSLCERGLMDPAYTSRSFSNLAVLNSFGQISEDKMIQSAKTAITALLTQHEGTNRISLLWGQVVPPSPAEMGFGDSAPAESVLKSPTAPIPWLIEHAFRTKQQGLINDPTLFDQKPGLQKKVAATADLYFCEEGDFDEAVSQSLEVSKTNPTPMNYVRRVVSLRPEVAKLFNPEPLIVAMLEEGENANAWNLAAARISELAMSRGPGEAERFLEQVLGILLPEGKATQEKDGLVQLLNVLGNLPGGVMMTLNAAKEYGVEEKVRVNLRRIYAVDGKQTSDPNLIHSQLQNAGLLKDLADFDVIDVTDFKSLQNSTEEQSLATFWINDLRRWMRSDLKEADSLALRELLHKANTFGGKLVAASLEDEAALKMIKVFDSYAVDLQNLPAEKQEDIASLATGVIRIEELKTQLTRDEVNTFRWLLRKSAGGQLRLLENFASAKGVDELGIDPERIGREAGETLKAGLIIDFDKTVAAFENLVVIGEQAVKDGKIKQQAGSIAEQYFYYVVDDAMPADEFAFSVAVSQSKRLPPLFDLGSAGRSAYKVLRESRDSSVQMNAFADLVANVHAQLDLDSNLDVTVPLFHQIIQGQSREFGEAVLNWSRGRDGMALYPRLGACVELAAMLTLPRDSVEWESARERVMMIFDAEDFTDTARAGVAKMVFKLDSRSAGPELTRKAVAQLPRFWEAHGIDVDPDIEREAVMAVREQRRNSDNFAEHDEEWAAIENELLDAYVTALDSDDNAISRYQRSRMDALFLKQILEMSIRRKRFPLVQRLLEQNKSEYGDLLPVFYDLVRYGGDELAGKMLRTNWEKLLVSAPRSLYFDQQLASRLAPFLDGFETDQEWLRWTGRFLIERGNDVSSTSREFEPADGFPDQASRMLELSRTLPADDFPDVNALRAVLSGLSGHPEALAGQRAALIRAAEGITIDVIEANRDATQKKLLEQMYFVALEQSIVDGDSARFSAEVDKLLNRSDERSRERYAQLFQRAVTGMLEKNPDLPDQSLQVVLNSVLKLPPGKNSRSSSNILLERVLQHSLMKYGKDGDREALTNRFANLEEHARAQLSKRWSEYQIQIRHAFEREVVYRRPGSASAVADRADARERLQRISEIKAEDLGLIEYSDLLLAGFLGAEKVSDLETKPEDLADYAVNLMDNSRRTTAEQRAILDKVTELIGKELRTENGWYKTYDNGWPPRSEIFQDFMKRSTPAASDLTLLLDLMWNDPPADLAIAWSHLYGQKDRGKRMWEEAVAEADDDASEIDAFKILLEKFRVLIPDDAGSNRNLAVLRPFLYETCRLWGDRPADLAAIVNYTDTLTGDPLALEFSHAARCWWASHWTHPKVDVDSRDTWGQVALDTLNGELSPNLRTELHHFYLYRAEHNCPKELRWKIVTDEADLFMTDVAINGYELGMVLNFFRDFEKDDRWKKLAEKYIEGWNRRNQFRGKAPREGIDYAPVSMAATNMLELHIELGDEERTSQFLDSYSGVMEEDPVYLPLLIRGGQFERAAALLARGIDKLELVPRRQSEYPSIHQIYFDKQLEDRLAEFTAQLKTDEERFFAGLIASSVSDPRPGDGLVKVDNHGRSKRLAALAGKFGETEFSNERLRKRALQLLCQNWETASDLESILAGKFEITRFENVPGTGNNSAAIDPVLEPLVAYAVFKLHEGDAKPIQSLIEGMGATSLKKTAWGRHRCLDRLGHYFIDMILDEYQTMNEKQFRAVFECLNTFVDTIEDHKNYRVYNRAYMIQSLIAHRLGANAELAEWRAALQEEEREKLERAFRQAQPNGESVTHYMFRGDPEGIDKAKAALRKDPWWNDRWPSF